jgi:hypothetical protein
MTYDADSTVQLQRDLRRQLRGYAASRRSATYCEQIDPRTEMVIGSWYLDKFGNLTREIKARDEDTAQVNSVRSRLDEPRWRSKHIQAAARMIQRLAT